MVQIQSQEHNPKFLSHKKYEGVNNEEEKNSSDESLWGSSLDFDDAEGEESLQDEQEWEELKSYDKVPAAINAQKVVDKTKLEPEMWKHFNKVSCEYNIEEDESVIKLKEPNLGSPKINIPKSNNSQEKIPHKGSLNSKFTKKFKWTQ